MYITNFVTLHLFVLFSAFFLLLLFFLNIVWFFFIRYNLVFVPLTGIDNHKRCVTFGANLLTKEDVGLYVWLCEQFKAMGQDPICIVTD